MRRTFRRRRREAKTDYKARLALLKSNKLRLVIRKTNSYIIVQLVKSETAQDKVISGASSKDLLSKGWPSEAKGSLKSLPAAYLTGYLVVKKASGKAKTAILDLGLYRNVQKSRIYAALKGAIDAGLQIPYNSEVLPSDEDLAKHKHGKLIEQLKKKLG